MGGVAALMLAVAYASRACYFNDTIIDGMDIETMHLAPVLGVLPRLPPPTARTRRERARSRKEVPGVS